jgi:hypothetical protein
VRREDRLEEREPLPRLSGRAVVREREEDEARLPRRIATEHRLEVRALRLGRLAQRRRVRARDRERENEHEWRAEATRVGACERGEPCGSEHR